MRRIYLWFDHHIIMHVPQFFLIFFYFFFVLIFCLVFAQKWNKIWRKQQFSLLFNFLSENCVSLFTHLSYIFFIVCIMKFWQRKYFAVIACHWHWHRHRHCHGSSINVIVIWSIFLQYSIYTLLCSATCIFWNWSERWTRYYNHNFERFNDGENEQFCIHLIIMISHFLFVDVVVDFYPYLFVNIISTHFLSLLFRLLLRWIYFGEVADTNEKWLRKNTTTKYIDW